MDKISKFIFILLFCIALNIFRANVAYGQNDYLYSQEYFDYLIECAQEDKYEQQQLEKEQTISNKEDNNEEDIISFDEQDVIVDENLEPFKLKIEENIAIETYSETFKKEDTKVIIPTNDVLSFVYNTSRYRNKNYNDGQRIQSGIEYNPFKFLSFQSGVETNYRDYDQNLTSRKLYFNPVIKLNDYVNVGFYNKYNLLNSTSDHDIGLSFSPLKSKALDFSLYAGVTNEKNGTQSQSFSFYTNFYFF